VTLEQLFSEILSLPISAIAPETSPRTVSQWDSLAHMQLITAIERQYSVSFSVKEIAEIRSFGSARRMLIGFGLNV
jgi:acyl carrier protein